jgi:hypothetical protein
MIRFQQASGVAQARKPSHRFAIDQTVRMKSQVGMTRTGAALFAIKGMMPIRDGSPQYRIRSAEETHDRVTTEDNLEAVDQPTL